MSKILVTGGAGFIGSHLAEALLRAGHTVHIIDNLSTGKLANVPLSAIFHRLDICDERAVNKLFAKERFGIIFHQAAQVDVRFSVENPLYDAEVNVLGFLNLMEAGLSSGLDKVIFASTGGAIYGDPITIPQSEDHPLQPICPYGVAKLAIEKYLHFYHLVHGIPYVSLRYANVYGPRQSAQGAGVIAIFLAKMFAHGQPIINGDGEQTRDYVHVNDIVEANMRALAFKDVGTFNLGSGEETSINSIFYQLRELTGIHVEKIHGPAMLGEQRRSVLDITRARDILGWEPRVDLNNGLLDTVHWYRNLVKPVVAHSGNGSRTLANFQWR